jgi:hypothetical protein
MGYFVNLWFEKLKTLTDRQFDGPQNGMLSLTSHLTIQKWNVLMVEPISLNSSDS